MSHDSKTIREFRIYKIDLTRHSTYDTAIEDFTGMSTRNVPME